LFSDETSDCESDTSSSICEELDASPKACDVIEQLVELPCNKIPKSVRFADDCGKELYSVRVMTEPSDYPPQINPNVLRRLRGDSYEEDTPHNDPAPTWNLLFKQPASEYVRFRETLAKVVFRVSTFCKGMFIFEEFFD
uniref:Protein phosphatase 1 regulatory subunit 3 (inferred by orthology to a C. elegans protein) n=1 Tax=Nippostrongylus brasiliensis TaxID=27835 RepID=A0A0N4XMY2_NIPBR